MDGERVGIDVPRVVRAKADAAPGGGDWVRDLPDLVRHLERTWSLTLTAVLPGGTSSFVARVRTQDGAQAVLKVSVPGVGFDQQVDVLARAGGDGYVRVLAHDRDRDAVLLEALGEPLSRSGLRPPAQLAVLARLLQRAWRVSPPPAPEPYDKAAGLATLLTDLRRDHPGACDDAVVEHALRCAERRSPAFDPAGCVVVHGDAATVNAARVLRDRPGTEDGFVLLDPDGFVGDPAYDLGVAVRDWCADLLDAPFPASLLAGYCSVLAGETGPTRSRCGSGRSSSASPPVCTASRSGPTSSPTPCCGRQRCCSRTVDPSREAPSWASAAAGRVADVNHDAGRPRTSPTST